MEYTKKELYEKFENLPDDVQEAFLSVDTYNTIKKIVDKFKLHIDQSGILSEEIGLVMLGITKPENFLSSIEQKLQIPLETAGEIVKEINTTIFFPIRASLEMINNGGVARYNSERPSLVENFSPTGQVSEKNIYRPEKPLQNSNNNAIIINKEVVDKTPRSDRQVFDEKMGKLFRVPKEEIDLGLENNPISQQKNIVADPYKEPLQ